MTTSTASDGAAPLPVRVLVVDDHEVVRRGVCDLLRGAGGVEVCGEAGTAAEALALAAAQQPDVALLDVRLPDGDGVELFRQVRAAVPTAACLMLTTFDDDDSVLAAVGAGASGFLVKQVRGTDIVEAVRTVAAGGSVFTPRSTTLVLAQLRDDAEGSAAGRLTSKERQVLGLVGDGLSNRQVGERLGMAEKTVKNHVSALLRKLHVQRRTQLVLVSERRRHGAPWREPAG